MKHLMLLFRGNNQRTLFGFNALLFAAFLLSPLWVEFSWAWMALSIGLYFLYGGLGISVCYHRILTHRAAVVQPWVERLFATFASLAGTGSPIMWVMTHRQHHRFPDRAGDPHPPSSVLKTFFGAYPQVSSQGIRDVARVRYYSWLHRYYFALLAAWALVLALVSTQLLFFAFIMPIFMAVLASNLLNWYGHTQSLVSYRTHRTQDTSQNNAIFGLLVFGEGWHNNHHRYPGSCRFGLQWWELDIGYLALKVLEKVGLASNLRVPHGSQTTVAS